MNVERVDFVSVLTQDIGRAKHFSSEVLGLEIESEGEHDLSSRRGQVTLDVFDPSSIGQPFAPSPAGRGLAGARRRCRARRARGERRRVRRRDDRDGRLPSGLVQGPRRERAHAPPEVRRMTRRRSLERYRALPLPTTKDEHWRFTDLAGFDPDAWTANGATDIAVPPSMLELDAACVVQVGEAGLDIGSRARGRPGRAAPRGSRAALLARRLGREVRCAQRCDVDGPGCSSACPRRRARAADLRARSRTRSRAARCSGASSSSRSRRAASRDRGVRVRRAGARRRT